MTINSSSSLQPLIEALREELKQYGELLATLDHQQESVLNRRADDVMHSVVAIQKQAVILQQVRSGRERIQRETAREICQNEAASFTEIIRSLPPEYRPLVQSLVQENNALLGEVHRRAHQNHLVLSRTVELMQEFLGTLFPQTGPLVYGERGNRLQAVIQAPPLYDAVG